VSDFGRRYLREYNNLCNIIFADMYKSIIAGTAAVTIESRLRYNFFIYNTSTALNDEIEYEIYAKSGKRTLELAGFTAEYGGIVSIYLDDILQGEIDLYTASETLNTTKTLAIAVVGSKVHSLRIKVSGQNVASTGYYLVLTWIRIK